MRLLAQSGQRNAALAQYETCHRLLETELAMTPDETTTGRKSGLPHTAPLRYEEVAGAYYVLALGASWRRFIPLTTSAP